MGDISNLFYKKIMEDELERKKKLLQFLTSRPLLRTTKEEAAFLETKPNFDKDELLIQRNIKTDIFIWLILLCVTVLPIAFFIVQEIYESKPNYLAICLFSLLCIFMLVVCYKNLTLKSLTTPIVFNSKSIKINNETFLWSEIEDTFMLYRFDGRLSRGFFVIAFKNGHYDKYYLANQWGCKYGERKFSYFVEYFKNYAQQKYLQKQGGTM